MFPAYADSKLAIMLFVDELARRGVRAYVADPGSTDTDITRDSTGMWGWWVGLRATPFLAQDPPVAARSGVGAEGEQQQQGGERGEAGRDQAEDQARVEGIGGAHPRHPSAKANSS